MSLYIKNWTLPPGAIKNVRLSIKIIDYCGDRLDYDHNPIGAGCSRPAMKLSGASPDQVIRSGLPERHRLANMMVGWSNHYERDWCSCQGSGWAHRPYYAVTCPVTGKRLGDQRLFQLLPMNVVNFIYFLANKYSLG